MSEPSRPAHTFILLQWLQAEATKKLIGAATSGYLKQVVLLLSLGADIKTKDEDGRTALYVASWKGLLEVAVYLVKHADVNSAR